MYYRVLTADEPAHADENFVRKDEATGLTLVSREALPASDDALINKVILASDGALYRYDTCGKPQLIGKTKRSVNALFRAQCRRTSAINRQCAWRARKLAEAANTASVSYGATLFGFRSYLYIDKQNLTSYPYRLKAARKTNMPLAVVFPSAGATGSDNVKTLFDALLMLPALSRKGATVLPLLGHSQLLLCLLHASRLSMRVRSFICFSGHSSGLLTQTIEPTSVRRA